MFKFSLQAITDLQFKYALKIWKLWGVFKFCKLIFNFQFQKLCKAAAEETEASHSYFLFWRWRQQTKQLMDSQVVAHPHSRLLHHSHSPDPLSHNSEFAWWSVISQLSKSIKQCFFYQFREKYNLMIDQADCVVWNLICRIFGEARVEK